MVPEAPRRVGPFRAFGISGRCNPKLPLGELFSPGNLVNHAGQISFKQKLR
jgi:hypothetical protein